MQWYLTSILNGNACISHGDPKEKYETAVKSNEESVLHVCGCVEKILPSLFKQHKVTTSELQPLKSVHVPLPHLKLRFLPHTIQSLYVLLSLNVLVKAELKLSMPTTLLENLKQSLCDHTLEKLSKYWSWNPSARVPNLIPAMPSLENKWSTVYIWYLITVRIVKLSVLKTLINLNLLYFTWRRVPWEICHLCITLTFWLRLLSAQKNWKWQSSNKVLLWIRQPGFPLQVIMRAQLPSSSYEQYQNNFPNNRAQMIW